MLTIRFSDGISVETKEIVEHALSTYLADISNSKRFEEVYNEALGYLLGLRDAEVISLYEHARLKDELNKVALESFV